LASSDYTGEAYTVTTIISYLAVLLRGISFLRNTVKIENPLKEFNQLPRRKIENSGK